VGSTKESTDSLREEIARRINSSVKKLKNASDSIFTER
jgi:hypothetical protein